MFSGIKKTQDREKLYLSLGLLLLFFGLIFYMFGKLIYWRMQDIEYAKMPVIVRDGVRYKLNKDDAEAYAVGLHDVHRRNLVLPDTFRHQGVSYTLIAIGDSAFARTGLRAVSVPNTVEWVGACAFAYCPSLSQFLVKDGDKPLFSKSNRLSYHNCDMLAFSGVRVLYLGRDCYRKVSTGNKGATMDSYNSFFRLDSLEVLYVGPRALKHLRGHGGFGRCGNLRQVVCRSLKPQKYKTDNFFEGYNDLFAEWQYKYVVLYVPFGTKKTYKASKGWGSFLHIREY